MSLSVLVISCHIVTVCTSRNKTLSLTQRTLVGMMHTVRYNLFLIRKSWGLASTSLRKRRVGREVGEPEDDKEEKEARRSDDGGQLVRTDSLSPSSSLKGMFDHLNLAARSRRQKCQHERSGVDQNGTMSVLEASAYLN